MLKILADLYPELHTTTPAPTTPAPTTPAPTTPTTCNPKSPTLRIGKDGGIGSRGRKLQEDLTQLDMEIDWELRLLW